jgi:DNA-binding transcriptional LysR family regulator
VGDLDDLALFLAVCEARGFRAAAKRLGLSPSTVSERVMQLEAQVGVPLLVRTTRSVMPTAAGRTLADRLTPLFQEVRAAVQDAASSRHEVRGLLRINVTGAVMVDILPPLLDRFLVRHPAVRIEIVVEDRLVDIIADGCEAGIRYGEHLAQDMIAVPLGAPQCYAVVASRDYVAKHGKPKHPKELLEHACIRTRFGSGVMLDWEFEKAGRTVKVSPPAKLVATYLGPALRAAHDGVGFWLTFEGYVRYGIKSGALVSVLDDWCPPFPGPFLYYPSRRQPPPALAAFVAFVAEWRKQERRKNK